MLMPRIFVAALMLIPAPSLAWGALGHRTIATIGYAESKPATRRAIKALLKHGAELDTPTCSLKKIEDAAVWPDCIKGLGKRFAYMSPWHYQDISVCHDFDYAEGCADGKCVTRQVAIQSARLRDLSLPVKERVEALALLVHFVGDMHQPLHIGEKGDKGGNDVRVTFLDQSGPRMNLHSVWDTSLAEIAVPLKPRLGKHSVTPAERAEWRAAGDGPEAVEAWAKESWAASRDTVYSKLGDYPDRCLIPPAPVPEPGALTPEQTAAATAIGEVAAANTGPVAVLGLSYADAGVIIVRDRIKAAGVRLGMVLDDALAVPVADVAR